MNNAHASRQKPLMELTEDDWALSMNTGLKGTLNFMKAAYPELKKTKGVIVNFGSGAGLLGQKIKEVMLQLKKLLEDYLG